MTPDTSAMLREALSAFRAGDLDEAERLCNDVLSREPQNPVALYRLGLVAGQRREFDAAIEKIKKAQAQGLKDPESHLYLGMIYHSARRYDEAITSYNAMLEYNPRHIDALNNLADIENKFGRVSNAETYCRRALEVAPDFYKAHNNLGNALRDQGRIADARRCYEEVMRLEPGFAGAWSNYVGCLCYDTTVDDERFHEEHLAVGRHFTARRIERPAIDRNPERPLRIGFVSPDFRTHSVAYFFEPILEALNRNRVEIYCYSDVSRPDPVTLRMRKMVTVWREAWRVEDHGQLARMIADDNIDILIDLAGHSAQNRLPMFAYKPAPVQITHIGYPATTGLEAMDYRITDKWADPKGQEKWYTEKLLYLESGFLCYKPPREAPRVSAAPSGQNGFVTFGSFNNLLKLNKCVIEAWAAVLKAVPGSQLMLKTKPFNDKVVRERFEALFSAEGIAPSRIILAGHSASCAEHLQFYSQVDIALDPFPYNGTTTTCEALWMGVPVVALEGRRHAARVSSSILTRIGLSQLVAPTVEKYVGRAAYLAGDIGRLDSLRKGLRAAVANSPLCDAVSYTRELENLYRKLWKAYLASGQP